MQFMFLLGSVAMDVLENQSSLGSTSSQKKLCSVVMHKVDKFLSTTAAGKKLSVTLASAKKSLQIRWATTYNRVAFEDARLIVDAAGRKLIAAMGEAKGQPNSSMRRNQLEGLWEKYTDLHLVIPFELDRKEDWIQSLMPLRQNQYFFLQVISQLEPDEYLMHLLSRFRPAWAKEDSWVNNPKAWKDAFLECGLWIHKKLPQGSGEKDFIKRHFPDEFIKTEMLEGHVMEHPR
jgi:hypothetical protein